MFQDYLGVTTPNVTNRTPTISESCVLKNLRGSPQAQDRNQKRELISLLESAELVR
jgi:hypothetical protein